MLSNGCPLTENFTEFLHMLAADESGNFRAVMRDYPDCMIRLMGLDMRVDELPSGWSLPAPKDALKVIDLHKGVDIERDSAEIMHFIQPDYLGDYLA